MGVVSLTICPCDFGHLVNPLSVTITEYLRDSVYEEKRSVLGHCLRRFSSLPLGSVALWPMVMVGAVYDEQSCSFYHSQGAKIGRIRIPMSELQACPCDLKSFH